MRKRKPIIVTGQGPVEKIECRRQPGQCFCDACDNMGPCNVKNVPIEGWSRTERIASLQRLTNEEAKSKWAPSMFGASPYGEEAAFLEGFTAALAFCSGSISGGRLREIARITSDSIDTFALNNYARSVMESTYKFWGDDK